ncbi:hypothetical protein WJX72_006177 [[Myrmecia] bisecta]|uniref:E3 ubiquitin-protein ligase SHPRH n=1 Tax=[Myrmecia] bisecta TaxID=41462 RepID=A0AAW1PQA5_9CHLO
MATSLRGLALAVELAGTASISSAAAIATAAALSPEIARCAGWAADFDRGYKKFVARTRPEARQYVDCDGELKSMVSVFSPGSLLTAAVKSLALHFAILWNKYMAMVDTANEEAELSGREPETVEWPEFPWDEIEPTLRASLFAFVRDITTLFVRRGYEQIAATKCSPRIMHKLLKDTRTSAVRKTKVYSRLERIPRVTATAFRCLALGSLAEFTVSTLIDIYKMLFRHGRLQLRQQGKRLPERLMRRIVANALRSTTSLLITSAVTGLASATTQRGWIIIAVATAADLGVSMFIISPPLERFALAEPLFPTPGAPGPAGGPGHLPGLFGPGHHGHLHPSHLPPRNRSRWCPTRDWRAMPTGKLDVPVFNDFVSAVIAQAESPRGVWPLKTLTTVEQQLDVTCGTRAKSTDDCVLKVTAGSAAAASDITCSLTDLTGQCIAEAVVSTPDKQTAQAFVWLCNKHKLTVQLGTGSAPASRLMHITAALTKAAFGEGLAGPEATVQRAWFEHLLLVLAWLMPEQSAEAHKPAGLVMPGSTRRLSSTSAAGPGCPRSPRSPNSPRTSQDGGAEDDVVEGEGVGFDAAELYAAVKPTGREAQLVGQPAALKPTLRPYQRRAAAWMVAREKGLQGQPEPNALHPLWREVPTLDGRCIYLNPFTGCVSQERYPSPPAVRGGILADEMGLGKTVELLACLLAHPFQPSEHAEPQDSEDDLAISRYERIDCVCGATDADPTASNYEGLWIQCEACEAWLHGACVGYPRRAPAGRFECSSCQRARAATPHTTPCGATLIICPTPILQQWQDEIAKHTQPGSMKVIVYQGQAAKAAGSAVVTAKDLAAADIVLTTYDVLRRDVHHQPDPQHDQRTLRRRKKYEVVPTPLTRLHWWRVCLDEAQMVESSTAKAAEMAVRLPAEHRWCVTGTPFSRGLEDLFGLMFFLRAAPLDQRFWWRRVCQHPYEAGSLAGRARLLALLEPAHGGLLWRSSKADVAAELGLPPQHHRLTMLPLSKIERHFYDRQHGDSVPQSAAAEAASRDAPAANRRLTAREEKKLLLPLLRLRQACCHPQVGAGGIKSLTQAKAPMTMDQILEVLTSKSRVEAEDKQRILLGALNGLGALSLLDKALPDAVQMYRKALQLGSSTEGVVRVDPLQKLHTLHNLSELLGPAGDAVPGVARTLRDSELRPAAEEIREKYMAEFIARLAAADAEYQESLALMERARSGSEAGPSSHSPRADAASSARASSSSHASAKSAATQPGWWLEALDLLSRHSTDGGERAAESIRTQLMERDRYRQLSSQNATSLTRRFRDLFGLKLLLQGELEAMAAARQAALSVLGQLTESCRQLDPVLVEQAGQCGRCRGSELGVAGRVCPHCRLDEQLLAWEVRLFSLQTRAMAAGQEISAEEAIRQAQAATLRRVGQGGYKEQAGLLENDEAGDGGAGRAKDTYMSRGVRTQEGVSGTEVIRQPSEAEQVLRLLLGLLRSLKGLDAHAAAQRDAVLSAAKVGLEALEEQRRVFLRARALSLAQRSVLYARDEMEMATMRTRLLAPGQTRRDHERLFKLYPGELDTRKHVVNLERISAEADLARALSTLRYLQNLKTERQRTLDAVAAEQVAGSSEEPGTSAGTGEARDEVCPLCHDVLGPERVMLPCAHQMCCGCSLKMVDLACPSNLPKPQRHIMCPICRTKLLVSDIAYVDSGRVTAREAGSAAEATGGEAMLEVKGSYGTKV